MAENNNKQQAILSIREILKSDKSVEILSELKSSLKKTNKKIIDKKQTLEKERKEREKQVQVVETEKEVEIIQTQTIQEETKQVEEVKQSTKKQEEVQESVDETKVTEVQTEENQTTQTQTEDKKQETSTEPVIQKTDNPNIVIINGKRVFVPNAKPVNKDTSKGGTKQEKRTFVPQNNYQGQKKRDGQGDRTDKKQGSFSQNKTQSGFTSTTPTAYVPKESSVRQSKKKNVEKNNYEDKKVVNKKSLIKGQMSIEDFDENKTGYRKVRKKDKTKETVTQTIKIEKAVITKEIISIKELSELLGIQAVEITKILFKEGVMKTINDSIDYDTAGFIAAGLGIELELKLDKTAEDVLTEGFSDEQDDETKLVKRPPVVTVMGHVDHGKTSLLDYIRNTSVTSGEAGGITQHIGAYTVNVNGEQITFLDTPGHAAFTQMRARGAKLTDIAIIVVACDDGIMPQTIEAINHAKSAGVTIIIAANKVDKQTADVERVKKGLADQEVLIEEWGGDVAFVPVSAKTGQGIDDLLETILISSEMKELKANPDRMAKGVIVEAKLDKGKGPMATVLVQNGTLKVGDYLVAGTISGKVRAMIDDKGRNVKKAGPSMPVSILGLEAVPNAGDMLYAVEEAKLSVLVANERKNKERENMIREQQKVSLDDLFSKISTGDLKTLNLIVKADVQGSVEAVKQSLTELSNDEVQVNVIHAAVGAISETDVSLADSSNSIIIGFNVRPDPKARALAESSKIDVKLYRIIYEAIEDIKQAMKGMLAPKFKEVYNGKAEVRETFKISGVGTVAGCYVVDGKIVRSGKLRIYRNDIMICEGNVLQLKRFKDDVKEVQTNYECGISIEKFDDIKVGDFIECYTIEEQKA